MTGFIEAVGAILVICTLAIVCAVVAFISVARWHERRYPHDSMGPGVMGILVSVVTFFVVATVSLFGYF